MAGVFLRDFGWISARFLGLGWLWLGFGWILLLAFIYYDFAWISIGFRLDFGRIWLDLDFDLILIWLDFDLDLISVGFCWISA